MKSIQPDVNFDIRNKGESIQLLQTVYIEHVNVHNNLWQERQTNFVKHVQNKTSHWYSLPNMFWSYNKYWQWNKKRSEEFYEWVENNNFDYFHTKLCKPGIIPPFLQWISYDRL